MHQVLSLKTKIWIVVGLAALIAGVTSWLGLHPLAIGTLVGVSMLFSGVSRLMLSLAARRIVTKLA